MKSRTALCGILALALVATSCSNRDEVTAPASNAVVPLSTNVPLDMGTFHNEIMVKMRARMALPVSVSYEEFIKQLKQKANKALEPYEPNREITDEDVLAMMALFHTLIEPYYDVTNRDPARSDVRAVFDNLLRVGMIDHAEHEQLVALSAERESPLPASQTIVTAMEVRRASLAYWSTGRIEPLGYDEEPPTKGIRNHLADWVGGMIGLIFPGAGPIFATTLAAASSLYFIVDGGSFGTGGASGGGGGGCSCCPHVGPPCD